MSCDLGDPDQLTGSHFDLIAPQESPESGMTRRPASSVRLGVTEPPMASRNIEPCEDRGLRRPAACGRLGSC
jgi:hypothetical protein